ncbi:MAG: tetraacyldisaccharide 4'-kinase, partial [Desulfomonilaceae bacterium]
MARNPVHPLGMMSFPLRPFLAASAGAYFLVQSGWRKAHELEWAQSYKAPIPVISVGNIAMGGTGKTPFVMYLVQRLVERGLKPCVISRGYRGSYATDYVVVSDGLSIVPKVDVKLVGDEPFLMATNLMDKAPLVVGKDRLKCIEFVHNNFSCDLAVLDDGFQHLKLKRDLDIVLLSGREDRMFPVGILREPISAITRADIIIMAADQEFMSKKLHDFLAFREYYTYRSHAVDLIGRDTLTKK